MSEDKPPKDEPMFWTKIGPRAGVSLAVAQIFFLVVWLTFDRQIAIYVSGTIFVFGLIFGKKFLDAIVQVLDGF